MSKYSTRALALAIVAAATIGWAPASAQSAFPPYLPRPTTFAGSCTGSTNGGGLNIAGGYATDVNFYVNQRQCDMKEGTGALSSASIYPGVAPQYLEARSSVDYGTIKTFAQMDIMNWQNQGLFFPRAFGQAGWVDDVVFNAPGLTGQAGTATGLIHLTGSLSAFGYQGNAGYSLAVMVGAAYPSTARHFSIAGEHGNPTAQTAVIDEIVPVVMNFIYGTPLAVGVFGYSVTTNTSEGGNHLPGIALSDFEHTIQWTGLSSVTAGGNAVSGYTVSTASGDDWVIGDAAVSATPEPASVALLATGLLVVVGVSRRRSPG